MVVEVLGAEGGLRGAREGACVVRWSDQHTTTNTFSPSTIYPHLPRLVISFNIFLSFKPYRCKWRHLDYTPEARAAFERCTGVAAAVAQIERVNFNIWLISMLLSPSGMGFFVIGKVIDYALAKSCNSYVEETPNQRAAFWNDNEIAYDNLSFFEKIGFTWRNLDKAKVVEYVRDYVLGPIYNGKQHQALDLVR